LRCEPKAIGGTADHIHVLTSLHPAVTLARLVAELKGASSHACTHRLAPATPFAWQAGYAAFSISSDDVAPVERYIRDQKKHHDSGIVLAEAEPSEEA
jgi:REP element-mobilizing transposase RayT